MERLPKRPRWWLAFALRALVCTPLTLLFLPLAATLLPGFVKDPPSLFQEGGLLVAALTLGGSFGLAGLWGAVLLEDARKSRRVRHVLALGLVVGSATALPFAAGALASRPWTREALFTAALFGLPVVVAARQLSLLVREGRAARADRRQAGHERSAVRG